MRESIFRVAQAHSRVAQAKACALQVRVERTLQRALQEVRVERTLQRAQSRCCITAILLTAAPASALACPVCALVGTSNNTWAYQAMSAMLTLLPLAMVGAAVWWLARLAARADTERQSATEHASTAHRSVGLRRVGDDGGLDSNSPVRNSSVRNSPVRSVRL